MHEDQSLMWSSARDPTSSYPFSKNYLKIIRLWFLMSVILRSKQKHSQQNKIMKSYFLIIFYTFSWFWQEEIITLDMGNSRNSEIQMFWWFQRPTMISKLSKHKKTPCPCLSFSAGTWVSFLFHFNDSATNSSTCSCGVIGSCTLATVPCQSHESDMTILPVQTSHFWYRASSLRPPSHQFLQTAELHSTGILWQLVRGKCEDTWAPFNSRKQHDLGNSAYTQSIFTDWLEEPPL